VWKRCGRLDPCEVDPTTQHPPTDDHIVAIRLRLFASLLYYIHTRCRGVFCAYLPALCHDVFPVISLSSMPCVKPFLSMAKPSWSCPVV
jgi:hypothetical protein